jgi:O-antigen ligase
MNAAFSCVLMFFFMNTPRGLRRYLPYLIVLFVVTILLYSLAVLNLIPGSNMLLTPITALSGKDMTFSGRTNIWAILNQHIALRPYLGSGYGAYWVELPTSPSAEMTARLYFYPTEAHNGYLDVINDLGAVGAIILIAYLVNYLRQGLRLLKSMPTQGILYLTLLFDQLIVNLTESRWLNCLTCEFTIMTIATVCLARLLMERQKQSKTLPSKPVPTPSKPRSAGLRLGPVPRRTL